MPPLPRRLAWERGFGARRRASSESVLAAQESLERPGEARAELLIVEVRQRVADGVERRRHPEDAIVLQNLGGNWCLVTENQAVLVVVRSDSLHRELGRRQVDLCGACVAEVTAESSQETQPIHQFADGGSGSVVSQFHGAQLGPSHGPQSAGARVGVLRQVQAQIHGLAAAGRAEADCYDLLVGVGHERGNFTAQRGTGVPHETSAQRGIESCSELQ